MAICVTCRRTLELREMEEGAGVCFPCLDLTKARIEKAIVIAKPQVVEETAEDRKLKKLLKMKRIEIEKKILRAS